MRFNPKTYNPHTDSSPVSAATAKLLPEGYEKMVILDQRSKGTGDNAVKTCESGSGKTVSNTKARFVTGGDAQLKGKLIRAHLSGTKVVTIVDGDTVKAQTALALTKARYPKFESWLTKAQTRYAEQASGAAERQAKADERKAQAEANKTAKAAERAAATEARKAKAAEAKAEKDAAKAAAKAAAPAKPSAPADRDDSHADLVGKTVEFKVGKNTLTGTVGSVDGDKITVNYETGSGKETVRVVKFSGLKVV